jgi:hypothetical protein
VCKRLPRPTDGYGAYAHYVEFGEKVNGSMRTDGSMNTGWTNLTQIPELFVPVYTVHNITSIQQINDLKDIMNDDLKLLIDYLKDDPTCSGSSNCEKIVLQKSQSFLYSYLKTFAGQTKEVPAESKAELDSMTFPNQVKFRYVLSEFFAKEYLEQRYANATFAMMYSQAKTRGLKPSFSLMSGGMN